MKGEEKILIKLNDLLADELTAINQYMVHGAMCDNWGYKQLHEAVEKRAVTEMHHAESIIERILFLDGSPTVNKLNKMNIGAKVGDQLKSDLTAELDAVKSYNEGIRLAVDLSDNGTRELFESILKDEEDHVDWIEAQLDQIDQMGIGDYLGEQVG